MKEERKLSQQQKTPTKGPVSCHSLMLYCTVLYGFSHFFTLLWAKWIYMSKYEYSSQTSAYPACDSSFWLNKFLKAEAEVNNVPHTCCSLHWARSQKVNWYGCPNCKGCWGHGRILGTSGRKYKYTACSIFSYLCYFVPFACSLQVKMDKIEHGEGGTIKKEQERGKR